VYTHRPSIEGGGGVHAYTALSAGGAKEQDGRIAAGSPSSAPEFPRAIRDAKPLASARKSAVRGQPKTPIPAHMGGNIFRSTMLKIHHFLQ
jgi:hypothetical protein